MTVAFIVGVLMISLLITLSICIWKKFDKAPSTKKSSSHGIEMKDLKKKKKKPKTNVDFLAEEEIQPFNAQQQPEAEKRLSSIKSFSTDSDADDNADLNNRSSPREQLLFGDNKSSASKLPNLSSMLSQSIKNLTNGSSGNNLSETPQSKKFVKHSRSDLARDESLKGVARAAKERRDSRLAVTQSTTSINVAPLDTHQLDMEIEGLLVMQPSSSINNNGDEATKKEIKQSSSVRDLNDGSRANSYSNIYLNEIDKIKKETAKKKMKTSIGNLKDINFDPGASKNNKSILSLTESEKSCY